MEWPKRMNKAIQYLEDNLTSDIDIGEAAKQAYCSEFHFQRIFLVVIGVTPAEYVRRRRLTMAAAEICSGNSKVIDVAMKYGYDSPDAFTRAFRNVHGITPLAARRHGAKLTAFPKVSLHVIFKGGSDMDYKILEKPAFDIIGKSREFTSLNKEDYKKIPLFWKEFMGTKDYETLIALREGKNGAVTGGDILGICIPNEKKDLEEFCYAIGIEKQEKIAPAGFEVIHIPAITWAVFESVGPMPEAIQNLTDRIYQEWFPSTGYEQASAPELEVYFEGNLESPNYRSQVWVPIVRSK